MYVSILIHVDTVSPMCFINIVVLALIMLIQSL